MRVALDLDGTIDSCPREFQSIMSALQAASHTVTVVTGVEAAKVTKQDTEEKKNYLSALGCGQCYDELVILPHTPDGEDHDLHDEKAQWLIDNGVDVFFDNNSKNAKAAVKAGVPLVLVPWASKEK